MKPSDTALAPILPHSAEAERCILTAIFLEHKSSRAVIDLLQPTDFFIVMNRKIFETFKSLDAAHEPIDPLSVSMALAREGNLEAAGGESYIFQLTTDQSGSIPLEHYAKVVKSDATTREVIYAAAAIQEESFAGKWPGQRLVDAAVERLAEIARRESSDSDNGISYREAAKNLLSEIDSPETVVRIRTGIDSLDLQIGGLRIGRLTIFTAETGTGKTLLAQQTRMTACKDGYHSLFCSGEMSATELLSRELAAAAQIPHWKMQHKDRCSDVDVRGLVQAASHACDHCRILDGELSMARIRRVARQMKTQSGLDLLILDYDELIEAPGETELDQQRYIVRSSKNLAIELKCAVILVSQLNKAFGMDAGKKGAPSLSRLYGSGAKAKHASLVLYVHRPYVQDPTAQKRKRRSSY